MIRGKLIPDDHSDQNSWTHRLLFLFSPLHPERIPLVFILITELTGKPELSPTTQVEAKVLISEQ